MTKPPTRVRAPPAAPRINGARPIRPPRQVIFTIVSANYIAYAATLMQSVRTHHPQADRFVMLADTPQSFGTLDLAATVIGCDDLDIPLIENMKLWYSVIEFNTAIKPYAFCYLLERRGYDHVVYLDPDILLFAPLVPVFAGLADHSLILTPHMMQPLQDGREPSDLSIMKSGVYNLGFLAVARSDEILGFMGWWAERCLAYCRVDVPANIFTDQRWMDLAPVFVARTLILRDTACNVAYWNIGQRQVCGDATSGWTVDGAPLLFFHFSGIAPDDPASFSKHQNRFTIATLGDVASLCDLYRARVMANGFATYRQRQYGYARFANGRPIEEFMRSWIKRAIDDERLDPRIPLELSSEFFDEPDETAQARGITLTRFMYQFWLDRPDLQRVFDIHLDTGLEAFLEWFIGGDAQAQGIDGRSIAAGALLHDANAHAEAGTAGTATPPWAPVARTAGTIPSREAGSLLRGDVVAAMGHTDMRLPIQAALAWELRADLQRAFPIADIDTLQDYVAWAMTAGLAEGVVDRALLTPEFIAQVTRLSKVSAYYKDVPLTEGMLITRRIAIRRDHLMGWLRFPTDRNSRLAHGFWFAFIAHAQYGWPPAIAEQVRAFMHQPTDFTIDGYALNRAEMAIWEMRADLQRTFPLDDRLSAWKFVMWLLTQGFAEIGTDPADVDPRLAAMLQAPSTVHGDLPAALVMVHAARRDLQGIFDLESGSSRSTFLAWGKANLQSTYQGTPLGDLALAFANPDPPAVPPTAQAPAPIGHRATLALTGQWTARSGRGEDLRCSVLSLCQVGYRDFIIVDRDTGSLFAPNGSELPAGPLTVTTNIVHLNADTAYADWMFLDNAGVQADRTIGWWAWELDRLPRRWLHAFSFYDEIWASTAFARAAFAREGARPVRMVPMAVIAPPDVPPDRTRLGLPPDASVFLFMFDFRSYASRKNPEAAVQAFLSAFPIRPTTCAWSSRHRGVPARPSRGAG